MIRNLKEGTLYTNKSGRTRLIVRKFYDIDTHKTRIAYVISSLSEPVKSCYQEQFERWLNL